MGRALIPLLLLLSTAAPPSPRECFQQFIDAVLGDDAGRQATLERCFDFEAWAAEKQRVDGAKFSDAENAQLRADWLKLLASDEFRDNWKRKTARITQETADGVVVTLTDGGREQKLRIRMKLNPAGDFWRWYWSEPVDADAADSPIPQPKTTTELLKGIAARLDEIAASQDKLDAERAELLRQQRRLLARIEEEQGQGPQGTPAALAKDVGIAVMSGGWEDFIALHGARAAGAEARKRFERQHELIGGWEVKDVSVREPGRCALVTVEIFPRGKPPRVIALRVKRDGGRWHVDEDP